ncbi:MAG TPA: alpha/beta fold hydrolase [Longimicrobium sp.]|nr:alpha/beta fold hydrolase [Longimicrobium sp.]
MTYTFDGFVLDTRRCELWAAGEQQHLEPQVYAVLCYLVEHRDRLVRKEELLDGIWGHRFVSPATLNSRIKSLRQALGDDGSAQRIIRTVRGVGFRFVAEVGVAEAAGADGGASPAGLESGGVRVAAREGAWGERKMTRAVTGSEAPGGAERLAASAGGEAKAGPPGGTHAAAFPRSAGAEAGASGRPIDQHIRFCRGHDGTRIAYASSGSGPVLLKPANWLTHLEHDWNSPVWRHWLTELSRDHTLVRYDERGSGLSDRDVEDVSFEAWLRDLEALLDQLGLERVPLLAISQGCALAVAFAALHPERVSRLVLYGGFLLGRLRRARNEVELAQAEAMIRVLPSGWGQDNPAFRQFFATIFLPEGTPEQLAWFSELQRVTTSADTAVRLLVASAQIDVREYAPRVRAPTLVLHVTGDAVVPFEQGRMLAGLIPDARFVPLEGRNHVILESEPAWPRFLEEVRGFLAEDALAAGPQPTLARVAPG